MDYSLSIDPGPSEDITKGYQINDTVHNLLTGATWTAIDVRPNMAHWVGGVASFASTTLAPVDISGYPISSPISGTTSSTIQINPGSISSPTYGFGLEDSTLSVHLDRDVDIHMPDGSTISVVKLVEAVNLLKEQVRIMREALGFDRNEPEHETEDASSILD